MDRTTDLSRLTTHARCPDCDCAVFQLGPRGGNALTLRCTLCDSRFWYSPPFPPARIDNDLVYYNNGSLVVLSVWLENNF